LREKWLEASRGDFMCSSSIDQHSALGWHSMPVNCAMEQARGSDISEVAVICVPADGAALSLH
jgi:hypothetical protein